MSFRFFRTLGVALAAMNAVAGAARAELTVMMSGGFALAYEALLPEFGRQTGIQVVTTSGASQGTGPTTIRAQLERGARPDLVILSREGLEELIAAGRIANGTELGLASTPLGAAVRSGTPKPDVSTVAALRDALLKARLVTMPGSTSGIFLRDDVFPRIGVADRISLRMMPRGIESTNMLAAGESEIALGPVSELVGQPGIDFVGPLPQEIQLVQEFTAAVVRGSAQETDARRLIAFLASPEAAEAVRRAGMDQVQGHRPR